MADEKPVTPPANKLTAGPRPRPAPVRPANAGPARPTNAGPARPGVTPANSPAAIPAIMRGPIAPPPTAEQIGAPGFAPVSRDSDARAGLQKKDAGPPGGSASPTPPQGTAAGGSNPPQLTPQSGIGDGDRGRAQPTAGRKAASGEPAPPQPTPPQGTPDGGPPRAQPKPPRGTADEGPAPARPTPPHPAATGGPTTAQATPPPGRIPTAQGTAAVPKPPSTGLQFRPVVHVADMAASVVFFEDLGAEVIHGGPDADYVLMQLGTVQIGLLVHPVDTGQAAVELNFAAAMPLDELEQRLRSRAVTIAEPVHNTDFGTQLHIRTPDGLLVKIGQLEREE